MGYGDISITSCQNDRNISDCVEELNTIPFIKKHVAGASGSIINLDKSN